MSPSEIAFLAFGLVFGAAVGGAIGHAIRRRPAPQREIRLTITPNVIPAGRTRTLAVPNGAPHPGPIPGSPDGEALADAILASAARPPASVTPAAAPAADDRTRVPSGAVVLTATAVAIPVESPASNVRIAGPGLVRPGGGGFTASAVAGVAVLEQPLPSRDIRGGGLASATLVRPRPPAAAPRPSLPAGAVAVADLMPMPEVRLAGAVIEPAAARPRGQDAASEAQGDPAPGSGSPTGAPGDTTADGPGASGPCVGQRRLVDERCALAGVARDQARAATDALHEARRAYDVVRERVDRASALADPRRVAGEKERLHAAFRTASDKARGPDETEAAARAWLDEINALNAAVRDANRTTEAGGDELRAALPALERRTAEADAARIAAENAEAGCHEAREELARCEEADTRARQAPPAPEEPHPFDKIWPSDSPELVEPAAVDLRIGLPAIVRILRGDREAREELVAELGAGDPDTAREWQLRVSRLVDAITGRAIEDGYLDLPTDDPFWRLFEFREKRDIVGALSALGFRYDGLGGFADGRVPAARDLSLAVGYAGLDRMRIRTWPRESEYSELYARATVAADEWLMDQAGDLSLGEMVDALGGRAAELADVWNAWGRVRPALLAE